MAHTSFAGYDDIVCDVQEQAVLNDSGARLELCREICRVGNWPKVAIENHVARVSDKLRVIRILADAGARSERFQVAQLRLPAKRTHLHGEGVKRSQPWRQLTVVHDNDFAVAGLGYDLLAKEGAASALDEIEMGIDFIGAVNG